MRYEHKNIHTDILHKTIKQTSDFWWNLLVLTYKSTAIFGRYTVILHKNIFIIAIRNYNGGSSRFSGVKVAFACFAVS